MDELSAWMQVLVACAVFGAHAAVLVLLARPNVRTPEGPACDCRALALLAGIIAAALLVAPVARAFAHLLAPLLATYAWAAILLLTDRIPRPRGLRALAVAILLATWQVLGSSPPVSAMKVPFSANTIALGWFGWAVSWAWLWLFGSMFARAGTITGVVPSITALAGLTFAAIAGMRSDLVPPEALPIALTLFFAGGALLAVERHLFAPSASAGAYAAGVVVGWFAAQCMVKNTALLAVLLPLLIIGMPLFAAVGPAAAARRHPRPAGPLHLHELLLRQGYSRAQAAAVEVAGTAYLCLLAVLLVAVVQWHWAAKLLIVTVWLAMGLVVGYVLVRVVRPARRGLSQEPVEIRLFGLRLHGLTMAQALERARRFIRSGRPHYIVTCDASALVRAQEDEQFRAIVNSADLVTADGAGVVLAARLLGLPVHIRVAGCDMVEGLCRIAAEEEASVFFLGAEPGVADEAARRLAERIPGLRIAGCHHGYFSPEEEAELVRRIASLRPGVLFVALGQPRQEQFVAEHLEEIGAGVAIGIGGSLDVISGRKRRAPVWMQRLGLEWLYRVAMEPSRLPRLRALPRVVLMAFAELLRRPQPR